MAISATRHVAGHDLSVTASLGISIYPNDSTNAVVLIKQAETAMPARNAARTISAFIPKT